jgi:hypothetical protein
MRKLCLPWAICALSLLAAVPARAADGPYVSAGYAVLTDYRTRCNGACDHTDDGFRVAVGWNFFKNFSVEALYLDAGHFVVSDITSGGTPFQGNAKVTLGGATLGYQYPIGAHFALGARVGAAAVKAEFTPGPAPAIAGGKTTTQFLGGLGASWQFTNWCSARLDWDHSRARMNRYDGDINALTLGVQFGF